MYQYFKILLGLVSLMFQINCYGTSLYVKDDFSSLFADSKANRVGDLVTIIIVENVEAGSSAGDGTKGAFNFNGGLSTGNRGWRGELGLGSARSGEAATNREGYIKARLTAKVVSKDDNGMLVLFGRQSISINGEIQHVTVEGTVRPTDIDTQNIVPSFRIQNASISIEGEGVVTSGKRENVFVRFIRWAGF